MAAWLNILLPLKKRAKSYTAFGWKNAMPEQTWPGRLETISDSAGDEWGNSIYFLGTVGFDAERIPGLLPGMSALVEFRR